MRGGSSQLSRLVRTHGGLRPAGATIANNCAMRQRRLDVKCRRCDTRGHNPPACDTPETGHAILRDRSSIWLPAGTISRAAGLTSAGSKQLLRITMAREQHNKAAEHHENAAKSHRAAAELHGKGEHSKGVEQSKSAQQHSQTAGKQSDQAHSKSQQQK